MFLAFGRIKLLTIGLAFNICAAQFPSSSNDDVTVLRSPVNDNITISYKNPLAGTCSTVFSTQKQYSGYVNLPPDVLDPSQGTYPINTFFWFIEARQEPDTAPLTVFINGGPGSSSMVGLFQEVGPCEVVEIERGVLGTRAREYGWDRTSNILFVDQPVQVGFSYDTLGNSSLNLLDETLISPPSALPVTQPDYTFLNGTFSSNNPLLTANTSQVAAEALWHFLQGFLATFPQYNPSIRPNDTTSDVSVGLNLFTESYGGKYGPSVFNFFAKQNLERQNDPNFANATLEIKLASLGIMNGWIDLLVQMPFHPRFAYNNTYNVQTISQIQELNALSSFSNADGCQQQVSTCRAQQLALDPSDYGNEEYVNSLCSSAQTYCQNNIVAPYTTSGRSIYDISQNLLDPFPSPLYLEYLNQANVQESLGTPLNYTQSSLSVSEAFAMTGDYVRDGVLQDLVDLLDAGIRIALIYGDRDYICNWLGGEAISFAIAGAAGLPYMPWYSAGYAPIVTNNSYIGGVVREFGNLSFSRIYDAGHLVPAYQPETAFTIFSRIIEGTGISLGLPIDLSTFTTIGDANATHTNILPPAADPTCYLRAVGATCSIDQKNMLANKAGVVIDGILYNQESDWPQPDPNIVNMAGYPGAPPSNTMSLPSTSMTASVTGTSTQPGTTSSNHGETISSLPTGVFTATGIPKTTSTSSNIAVPTRLISSNFFDFEDTQPAAMVALGLITYGFVHA